MKTMFKSLLKMMKKDDDAYSIGRVCAVISFIIFILLSVYLAINEKQWQGYTVFAHCTIGYIIVQLANKAVDVFGFKISAKDSDRNAKD